MTVMVIGAVLLVAGVVYMAGAALRRGQLSDPHAESSGLMPGLEAQGFTASGPTLEPSRRGLRFLGITANWPGLLMLAAGAVLLLSAVV